MGVNQEDAFAAMLEQVFILGKLHDPTDTISFSSKLGRAIPNKFIDYLRRYHKDYRYKAERESDVFLTSDNSSFDGEHHDEIEIDSHPEFDMDGLSEEGQQTMLDFALPLRRGAYIGDLAELHGVSVAKIRKKLKALALERR